MSLFRPERRADSPTNDLTELYLRRRMPTDVGVSVTADSAKRQSAVWACIDLIAGLISTLPVDEFRREADRKVELDKPGIFVAPDGMLTLSGWLYQLLESLLTKGNAYGLVLTRDREGWPTKIQLVSNDLVQVEQQGVPYGPFRWKLNGKPIRRFDPVSGDGDLWHIPAYLVAGSPIGLSPVSYAALTIGTGLGAQEFGARWFRDNATPSAVLKNEKDANRTTAQLVKQRWTEALSGNREPVVLAGGWEYEAIQVQANESQFLETIRASVADIARFFRVPPSEIGAAIEGDSDTYANDEQRSIALLKYTINPWLVRLEESLTGLRPRGRFVKFNIDALLRTDLMTRYQAHELAIVTGWRNVDETRAIEDMAPLPGGEGEKYLWPPRRQQLTEEELGTGDEIEGGIDNTPEGEENDEPEEGSRR